MKPGSIRLRLLVAGAVSVVAALAVAGAGLTYLFERHVERRVEAELATYLDQLIAGVGLTPDGTLVVNEAPADPRFFVPLSGLVWQVTDPSGTLIRSRSLWDETITLPADDLADGAVHMHEIVGPDGGLYVALERQVRDVEAEVERLENLLRTAPQLQAEYVNLNRDYDVLRKNYDELLARRESLQIAGAARTEADRVRLEVVEPPTVPLVPIGPNRLLFATGVLFAGLGAGGVLVLLLVQLDRGFYTVHDLRKLGLPVLGAISSAKPARRAGAAAAFAVGVVLLLLVYGVVLAGGPAMMAKLPNLVARLIA